MGKYWYKCKDCNKKIKKQPGFVGEPLCLKCANLKNTKKCSCLNCGNEFEYRHKPSRKERKYCSRECAKEDMKHNNKGRVLTKEHKEKLSKAAQGKNGLVGCKFYSVFCSHLNKYVKVQGTWELKYTEYLNNQNIKWTRERSINIQYKFNNTDITRTYYPDFYLVDYKKYIEIKGAWLFNSKEKMDCVIKQNPDKDVVILEKTDLLELGIKVK